jgi:hypothetical protein
VQALPSGRHTLQWSFLPKFFDLLKKLSSSLSKYTQRLFIHGNYISAPMDPSEYSQLQITLLFLYNIEAKYISANLPSIFSAITILELDQVFKLTLADLAQIFYSFSCLQIFSFNDSFCWGEEYEIPELDLDLPTNLQLMNVCCKELMTFLGWFLSKKDILQLTTLHLHGTERSDIKAFIRLLQVISNSLEHLELGLAYFQDLIKTDLFCEHFLSFLYQSASNHHLI